MGVMVSFLVQHCFCIFPNMYLCGCASKNVYMLLDAQSMAAAGAGYLYIMRNDH
jgi:hypothetical protein